MERIEKLLYDASIEGNLTILQMLIQEDPLILDKLTLNHYDDMPLHIASMLGHIDFVKEILIRKPDLSMEYDSQRRLPLHIAAAKGHVEIVKALVSANPETCLACDRDGRNAIHLAAIRGRYEVVKELMRAQPHAARAMVQHDTILHLCVKYNQLEVLKFLVVTMSDHEFLNSGDADGNTLLHLAVADKQIETVNFLVRDTTIEVNALNTNGETSIEMLSQGPKDVKDQQIIRSLKHVGAPNKKKEKEGFVGHSKRKMSFDHIDEKPYIKGMSGNDKYLAYKRNTLMLVATFVAAISFQANINPPGGVWQDTVRPDTTATYSFNQTGTTQTNATLTETTATNKTDDHQAGYAIMQTYHEREYHIFLVANTLGFVSTSSIVLLLTSEPDYLKKPATLWILVGITIIATSSMSLAYVISMVALSPESTTIKRIVACIFGVWGLVLFLIYMAYIELLFEFCKKYLLKTIQKLKHLWTGLRPVVKRQAEIEI